MVEQRSRWVAMAAVVAAIAGLLSAGCGRLEEADYPHYEYVPPKPPTAEELAAEQRAREQAAAENREILIGADDDEYADTDPSALTQWRSVLEPHGTWVDDPVYGTVWVPSKEEVGDDFQPYVTAGHWTYSEETDYVWVSHYSWGWVPFHYGRWVYLPNHGWAWIPGRRYAGAWVTWRVGPAGYGYVGWAPMAPTWYWYNGVAVGWSFGFYRPYDYYVYCPHTHLYHPTVVTHVVRGPAARVHHERTRDYVPAAPAVGGGDRVIANPTVGGGSRVVAQPSVGGGRVVASPVVAKGPRPDELGSSHAVVVPPPASDQGIARAQAFAVPRTAVAAGAAPPAHWRSVAPAATAPSNALVRQPATAASIPREALSAAREPAVRSGPALREPSAASSALRASPSSSPLPPYRAAPRPESFRSPSAIVGPRSTPTVSARPSSPSPAMRSTPRITSTPSWSSSPTMRSPAPAIRSTPRITSTPSPAIRSTPRIGSSPSFRSTPAVRSSPTIRAPAVRSAPAMRSPSTSFKAASPAIRSLGTRKR